MTSLVFEASPRAACVSHTGLWVLGPVVSGEGQTGSWGPGLPPELCGQFSGWPWASSQGVSFPFHE